MGARRSTVPAPPLVFQPPGEPASTPSPQQRRCELTGCTAPVAAYQDNGIPARYCSRKHRRDARTQRRRARCAAEQ